MTVPSTPAAGRRQVSPFQPLRSVLTVRLRHCFLLLWTAWQMSTGLGRAAEPIIPPNAKLEHLFDGVTLTEGVAVAPDGQVYFSDITFSYVSRNERGQVHAG